MSGITSDEGVVDLGIYHSWASSLEVFEYLRPGWREYVIDHMPKAWRPHMRGLGPAPDSPLTYSPMSYYLAYLNPTGRYLQGSVQEGAGAGCSDYATLHRQHIEPMRVRAALLCHGLGMLVPAIAVPRLSAEFVRAINDWTIERWLPADSRLRAAILVPTQIPDVAAAEIVRVARRSERMVAVMLGANGLGKPFGHPAYRPIFEAAHECGLRVIIRAGGDELIETPTYPAAGGRPNTYTEFRALSAQPVMTHVASLIGQGVMGTFSSLRFLVLGAGVGWISPFLWRFDTDYKAFRHGMLWMKAGDTPSTVFRRHFLVGTDPFTPGTSASFADYLAIDPELKNVLCYSSGYPDAEYVTPTQVAASLPEHWVTNVLRVNGLRFLEGTGLSVESAVKDREANYEEISDR